MYKLPTNDPFRWSIWIDPHCGWVLVTLFASEQAAINYIHSRRLGNALVIRPLYTSF